MFWIFSFIAVGLTLSFWAIWNLLLFVIASEPALRPKIGMLLIVSALVGGISMLVRGFLWWKDTKKFRRNTMTSLAQVLGRQKDFAGDFERSYFSYRCYLSIGFNPAGMESSGERIELRARVKEEIYRKHLTGQTITVQYAADDPKLAILEGE